MTDQHFHLQSQAAWAAKNKNTMNQRHRHIINKSIMPHKDYDLFAGLFRSSIFDCGCVFYKLAAQRARLYLIMWKYGAQNINIHPHTVHPWGQIITSERWNHISGNTEIFIAMFFQSIMMHIIRVLVGDHGWHCNQWNQIPSFCTLSVTYVMFLIKKGCIFF